MEKENKEPKVMNVYQKLQKCRVELQKSNLKKTGENNFSHYTYYELGDFLPKINELLDKYFLAGIFQFGTEEAKLTIINTEKLDETIVFSTPVSIAQLKGCYEIQNIGATQTYARRYLYVMAFEIAESEVMDDTEPDEELIYKGQKIDIIKINTINEMLKKTRSDVPVFLKYYKLKQIEDMTNGNFVPIMKTLQDKLEKQEKTNSADLGM